MNRFNSCRLIEDIAKLAEFIKCSKKPITTAAIGFYHLLI